MASQGAAGQRVLPAATSERSRGGARQAGQAEAARDYSQVQAQWSDQWGKYWDVCVCVCRGGVCMGRSDFRSVCVCAGLYLGITATISLCM